MCDLLVLDSLFKQDIIKNILFLPSNPLTTIIIIH